MKLLKLILILKTLFRWRWEPQISVNPLTNVGTSACVSSKGPGSICSSLAVRLWKSAREGAGVREAGSVQHSNKWLSEHILKVGSWICRKAACLLENKAPVKASSCELHAVPCTRATNTAIGRDKQNLPWSPYWHGDTKHWEKSYAITTLATGNCLVRQEACRPLWPSWDKLFLLTHRVDFTQWSLSCHFCKSRWGPADYGEKLENSKLKVSESQPKKMTIFTCSMTIMVLVVAWECGGQAIQQQQPGGWTKTSYHRREGSMATLQGWWLISVPNMNLQSSSWFCLCWATEQALINHILVGGMMVSTIQ